VLSVSAISRLCPSIGYYMAHFVSEVYVTWKFYVYRYLKTVGTNCECMAHCDFLPNYCAVYRLSTINNYLLGLSFLADHTALRWHNNDVCLSVTLCIVTLLWLNDTPYRKSKLNKWIGSALLSTRRYNWVVSIFEHFKNICINFKRNPVLGYVFIFPSFLSVLNVCLESLRNVFCVFR